MIENDTETKEKRQIYDSTPQPQKSSKHPTTNKKQVHSKLGVKRHLEDQAEQKAKLVSRFRKLLSTGNWIRGIPGTYLLETGIRWI